MTNREQASMTRNEGCCAFLDKNIAIFEEDVAFNNVYIEMVDACAAAVASATDMEADNTGYCVDKIVAKNKVCEMASALCGNAQIKLKELDNMALYNMLHSAKRYYLGVADALTRSRLQLAYNIINLNKLQITTDYITLEQLADFKALIIKYYGLTGETTNVERCSTLDYCEI